MTIPEIIAALKSLPRHEHSDNDQEPFGDDYIEAEAVDELIKRIEKDHAQKPKIDCVFDSADVHGILRDMRHRGII